mmetsp:Transcript_8327/g.17331  ORF Transcript_8327/g.17331 Transcript_8327/m.17331 type:complete len:160 (-) Transcript_8327:341-820(-)
MTIKEAFSKNDADSQDIPMASEVLVLGDIEMADRPPARNTDSALVQIPGRAIGVSSVTAVVPARTHAVDVATTNNSRNMLLRNLGRRPFGLRCQHCNRETITIVEDRINVVTILLAIFITLLFWPLCWVPFCMSYCKDTLHFCGHESCRKKVGVTSACA